MGRRTSGPTTIISAVSETSSKGSTRSTRGRDVAVKVGLTGSATEDTARSVGPEKAVEGIAAQEEATVQDGLRKTTTTIADRCHSLRTTTTATKKHDIERTEEQAPVPTQQKRPHAGPTSPAKKRKVDPLTLKIEGDALPKATSHVDLPRTPRIPKLDSQTPTAGAPEKVISQADLPQTARRRKSESSTTVKVEENDRLTKAISHSNSPKTPRKRGRHKDTGSPSTPTSLKTKPPVQRGGAANDVTKGPEAVVDTQAAVIDVEMELCSVTTAPPPKGHTTGPESSKSPAKRKHHTSVDVEPSSFGRASLPVLEFPPGNTPSLWASNKIDLVILTSKLDMVTTIFVDQESAINIAIQDGGEVELSMTRDCSHQSALFNSLTPLDEPEAPEPPPKDVPGSSLINMVDPYPSTPAPESEISMTHVATPISSSSDRFPGAVNIVTHYSSTQFTETSTPDSSIPGLSIHESLKTCDLETYGRVSQHRPFGDLTRGDTKSPSTSSFPPAVRNPPSPLGLRKPDVAIGSSPSIVFRDQMILDMQPTFSMGSNHAPLLSASPSTPPPPTTQWDQKWDSCPGKTSSLRPGSPPRHFRHWDSEWDRHPQERDGQQSGSPIHHHKYWDNSWDDYPRETGSGRPIYSSPSGHSSFPSVLGHHLLSGRPGAPSRMKDPRRPSPSHRSLETLSPVLDSQPHVPNHFQVSMPRSSKSRLPSFKKIRNVPGGSALPPAATSSPRLPGPHIHESRPWPTLHDTRVHGGSHMAGGYHNNYSPSSFSSSSARRHFYDQQDHPYRKTESSLNTYSERLELYSSKKSSLTDYMMGVVSQGTAFQRNLSKGYQGSGRPSNPPLLPRFSTAATVPIIKEEVNLIYPFRLQPARGSIPFILKRSSSPPLAVPSAIPPAHESHPSSPDSLYAPSPTRHNTHPLNVPCEEDTYMLDDVPFSPTPPPPMLVSSTSKVDPSPPSTVKPPTLAISLQEEHNAKSTPRPHPRSEKERNVPNASQSDISCEDGASNIHEAGLNSILRQQLGAEQIVNPDLVCYEPSGLHSAPQEIGDASESNPVIYEPLQATSPEIQQPTNNNVALSDQADVPDNIVPIAKEADEMIIGVLPETQQFANTDFPVLLFVPFPGYGYASLGYFRNLGIVSKTSADGGKRTIWRARLRWVADEEYEDETLPEQCWWSEQKVVEDLEDKFMRDQCPGLGMSMRAVERWWCRRCGRVNREDGWKWRRCSSEKCKDKQPEFLKAISLDEVRGRNDRMPMARPHAMVSVPGIMTTTWEDGTVTYMYPLSASRLVKHIFTGNYPPLQEDASKLWVGLQGKGVELFRDRDGPYYTCAFVGNRENWPEIVKEASEVVGDSAIGYGEFSSGMNIQRVEVLAWFIKGSAKFKVHETGAVGQVLRAKQSLVGILSLGCEVEIFLHKCRAVGELYSTEGLLTFTVEHGTKQVMVDAERSTAKPSSPRKKKVPDVGDLSIHMVHGDVLILSGDDFEYNIKRSGCGMLVIASSNV